MASTNVIPLQIYRISPRKARIELQDDAVGLFLPSYFGRRRFEIPISGLTVCDLTSPLTSDLPTEDVFMHDISIPYLFTTGPLTMPTLLLLFSSPLRVPPLRMLTAIAPNTELPFGWKESRSKRGAFVDGVLLRAPNTSQAACQLIEVGAHKIDDPSRWLHENRERIVDPVEPQWVVADIRRRNRLVRGTLGTLYASVFAFAVLAGREQPPLVVLVVLVIVAVASIVINRVTARSSIDHQSER